ncbi:DNA polymerase I [Candidatus Omnitrophota bacterium]
MSRPKLFLIDANSFCYRAFYAIKELSTSYGQPTNAIYGFIMMLKKIIDAHNPEYVCACFDVGKETFRQKRFAEYKIHRPPMPDGLSSQIPRIKEVLSAYDIATLELAGYEADDLLATLAKKAAKDNMEVFIVSSDKDILQAVNAHIKLYSPYKEDAVYDSSAVKHRFGVEPEKIPDVMALMGDAADNIPGVKGIGEKTATELIKEFGSLENILKNLDKIESEKLRTLIQQQKNQAIMSKELATLDFSVPVDFEADTFKRGEPDIETLFELFKEFEFKKLLGELPAKKFTQQKVQSCTITNQKQLKEFVERYSKKGIEFSFFVQVTDLELAGGVLESFLFCQKHGVIDVVPLKYREQIGEVLENKDTKKIVHNLKDICTLLLKNNLALNGELFDVRLAAYLLDPAKFTYTIEDIVWDYLKIPAQESKKTSDAYPSLLLRIKPELEKELKKKALLELFNEVEVPLAIVLSRMETNGVALDKKVLKDLSRDLDKRIKELIASIYKQAGEQFNINSPKQLSNILFEKLKLPVVKKTKTGFSTNEEVLKKLSQHHAIASEIIEYRQLVKLKSTYIDALPKLADPSTGKIHTSFNQAITETGRLSSSNPNLQNIPIRTDIGRQIRRAFVASKKNNSLLSADYSQIELRMLAHLSKDETLVAAFKNDEDVHQFTASLIFDTEKEKVTKKMREVAKRVNFGIVYGMSSFGLAKDLRIPQEEAEAFIDSYFSRYPKVKEFINKQIHKAEKDGFVTTLLGRRRYLPQINSKNLAVRQMAQRQAINAPVQGSAADLIKLAMIKIQETFDEKSIQSRIILQVHDELLFDVVQEEFDTVKNIVKDIMEASLTLLVPIGVVMTKGKNWLEKEMV